MGLRIAKGAGIQRHVSPHSLRHAAISNALDAGVPLRDAQILARHADPPHHASTTTAPEAASTAPASASSPPTSPASSAAYKIRRATRSWRKHSWAQFSMTLGALGAGSMSGAYFWCGKELL